MNMLRNLRVHALKGRRGFRTSCALLSIALLGAGCSSFERAWRKAAATPDDRQDAITGRWEGTWRSDVNGHHDRLRGLIKPASNGVHSARFHANYKKGILRFTFGYTVPLQAERQGDSVRFQGEANLGWLAGGVYRYRGEATATNFSSTYHSKYDYGVFQMTRPAPVR